MPEPTEVVVRGDPLDVFERLRTTHIGQVVKSVEFDHTLQEVVVKLAPVVEQEFKPLELNTEESYLLNHLFHIGMSTVYEDFVQVMRSTAIAGTQIANKFDDATFTAFQKKMNNFFVQYRKEGDTVTEHGENEAARADLNRPNDASRLH